MLEELKTASKVVGVKQLRKALGQNNVKKVYIAEDADPALIDPLLEECNAAGVEIIRVATMKQLGAACNISVKAAAAAIV